MDCKVGVRTYLEEELAKAKEKPKLRKVLFLNDIPYKKNNKINIEGFYNYFYYYKSSFMSENVNTIFSVLIIMFLSGYVRKNDPD